MFQKAIRIVIIIAISIAVVLLLMYGVSKSDFNNLKKYNVEDDSISEARMKMQTPSKLKVKIAEERYYSTKVRIKDGDMANLGDFTLNISDDRKLIANISLKFKEKNSNAWLIGDSVEKEILEKGDVLRNAVINTLSQSQTVTVSNKRIKKELVKNINNYLSDGEVEEVYFNRFIIQ